MVQIYSLIAAKQMSKRTHSNYDFLFNSPDVINKNKGGRNMLILLVFNIHTYMFT